jgi:hypothetical protein
LHPRLDGWLRALAEIEGQVRVGLARIERGGPVARVLAQRWTQRLGGRGGVVLHGPDRLLWFELAPFADDRAGWTAATAGLARALRFAPPAADGRSAITAALAAGLFQEPTAEAVDGSTLLADFRQRFPDGVSAALEAGVPPDGVGRLSARMRSRLWQDALRSRGRSRLPFDVTSFRPGGEVRLVFALPRTRPATERVAWRARVEAANWRSAVATDRVSSKRGESNEG